MVIYIQAVSVNEVMEWLLSIFTLRKGKGPFDGGAATIFHLEWQDNMVPVILTPGIENSDYMEVWFNTDKLPWNNILDLVLSAAKVFNARVRYEKSDSFYEYFRGQTRITQDWD